MKSPEEYTPLRGSIMIIDDNRENVRLLVDMLSRHGHQVRPAMSGQRALKAIQVDPPDVILLDVMMPGMNGFAVCEALKADQRTSDIPVIFISALNDVFDKVKAFSAGGVDYVTKPFQVEEVLARVHAQLALRQTQVWLRESEARYRAIVEDQTELICRFGADMVLLLVNMACRRYVGQSEQTLIGQRFLDLFPTDEQPQVQAQIEQLTPEQPVQRVEHRMIDARGQIGWVEWTERALYDQRGQLIEFQAVGRDITERVQAQRHIEQVNQHLERAVVEQELLNRLSSVLQRCQTLKEAYTLSVPFLRDLFAGQRGRLYCIQKASQQLHLVAQWGDWPVVVAGVTLEDCVVAVTGQANIMEIDGLEGGCMRCMTQKSLPVMCINLVSRNERLGMLHVQGGEHVAEAVYERWCRLVTMVADLLALTFSNLLLRERLREQAIRDPLTGLFNRRFLDEVLTTELHRAARYQCSVGIFLIDIDYFKRVNDTFGHDIGDLVLRQLSDVLRASLRAGDTACRYGGEEIILVLPEISMEHAYQRANDLRRGVETMHIGNHHQQLPAITVSIGVAGFPCHGSSAVEVITAADRALYRAKAEGRNRVSMAENAVTA
ncbi:MAG: diguanylate cyclase [Chloroflexaceae bacterium]|nr:diguanylate cyclase [Chloroflexaceae bacterium]